MQSNSLYWATIRKTYVIHKLISKDTRDHHDRKIQMYQNISRQQRQWRTIEYIIKSYDVEKAGENNIQVYQSATVNCQ